MRSFNIRRNEQIAAHVTVRGAKALEIIERGLKVKEYELKKSNFSNTGMRTASCYRNFIFTGMENHAQHASFSPKLLPIVMVNTICGYIL